MDNCGKSPDKTHPKSSIVLNLEHNISPHKTLCIVNVHLSACQARLGNSTLEWEQILGRIPTPDIICGDFNRDPHELATDEKGGALAALQKSLLSVYRSAPVAFDVLSSSDGMGHKQWKKAAQFSHDLQLVENNEPTHFTSRFQSMKDELDRLKKNIARNMGLQSIVDGIFYNTTTFDLPKDINNVDMTGVSDHNLLIATLPFKQILSQ